MASDHGQPWSGIMTVVASSKRSLPRGRQPWDPANGLRVGTLTGGLVGAAVVAITGLSNIWIIAVGGAIGGGLGWWSQKRALTRGSDEPHG